MDDNAVMLQYAVATVVAFARLDDGEESDQQSWMPSYQLDAGQDTATYQIWWRMHERRRATARQELSGRLARSSAPTIAVLVPVYRPEPWLLRSCIDSVLRQSYANWELCLADDASDDSTFELLEQLATADSRIRIVRRPSNGGISRATNDAARLTSSNFLAFLDQDDELEEDALLHVAAAILDNPTADVLYTDQDKLAVDGVRSEPYFKPAWSPDLLLSNMYMAHLLVVRRSLFEELDGLRPEFDGSQDYDLALRATEAARSIVHVPVIGYHWRRVPGSTALDYGSKPEADIAARRALADAMSRRGVEAQVEDGLLESTFRVRRTLPRSLPLVSIIVPFHDGAELLRKCVDSLHATAGYERWEALLVDNRSWQPETVALTRQLAKDDRVRLLEYAQPFNWSAINNWAVRQSRGEILLFLNSDIEGRAPGWLAAMVEHVTRPEVGAVGARLIYPDGRVQHAGVVLGLGGGVAWHAFCYCPPSNSGYFGHARMTRNYSAVTGACLMVQRKKFDAVGGFDEELAVAFNDIDFCLRIRERGGLIVYTPFAELIHYEGASRGRGALETEESKNMFRRWGHLIRADPYFNPNLNALRSEFALSIGETEESIWA